MLPTSRSVKFGPFHDVLSVRCEITSRNVMIQVLVRNNFDCSDWMLYVVSSLRLRCLHDEA